MNILHRVTSKTLLKNKTRTIVTIIGVVLSVAMVTAVTSFISSTQNFLLRNVSATEGNWQAGLIRMSYQKTMALKNDDAVDQAAYTRLLGFAKLEGSINDAKPYLCVQAFDEEAFGLLGISPMEGRLPENDSELLISEHIWLNGGVRLRVGDTLTLPVGDRVYADGSIATDNYPYSPDDEPETLSVRETKTYTIVGICERPGLESYSAGGYSVLTLLEPGSLDAADTVSLYVTMKQPRNIFETMPAFADEMDIRYHSELLRYMGISQNDNFNAVMYSMAAILIVLIMVGSISLIYNAFAISVSERSRQFGMLSSVGATSRQIRNSVIYEALVISGIGIPLGVLSGIAGTGATLYLLRDSFSSLLNGDDVFFLSVSVPAILIAAVVGLLTVLISAYIPARRAARLSAIEAIRQTGDIRLRSRQVRTPRWVRKLFGLEGDLALKNFKRNRRRYRATVFSLFISVVLFISVSTYTTQLKSSVTVLYGDINYSLAVTVPYEDTSEEETQAFYHALENADGVKAFSMLRKTGGQAPIEREQLTDKVWELGVEAGYFQEDASDTLGFTIIAPDEKTFARYIDDLGLNLADYTDTSRPRAIVVDKFVSRDRNGRYVEGTVLQQEKNSVVQIAGTSEPQEEGDGETSPASVTLGAYTDKTPLGVTTQSGLSMNGMQVTVNLIVSPAVFHEVFDEGFAQGSVLYAVDADNPSKAEESINSAIKQLRNGFNCINYAAQQEQNEKTILIFNVLTYGFIALISLITIANVFNTISTNMHLRRREFAMLRSVGMTQKGFRKMMNFECLFYGLKALLYGLPVSLLVVFLIRAAMLQGVEALFTFPWLSFAVAIFSVFLVVFITMMYAMSKIRRENIVDALKNENQ